MGRTIKIEILDSRKNLSPDTDSRRPPILGLSAGLETEPSRRMMERMIGAEGALCRYTTKPKSTANF